MTVLGPNDSKMPNQRMKHYSAKRCSVEYVVQYVLSSGMMMIAVESH